MFTKDNLLVVVLLGVLILIALWPMDGKKQTQQVQNSGSADLLVGEEKKDYRTELEKELQNMLQQMDGVGAVRVMITLKQREEVKVKNSDILWNSGEAAPAAAPEVEGILVLAQGAGNAKIREDITETAKALFDVEANKVKVAVLKASGH